MLLHELGIWLHNQRLSLISPLCFPREEPTCLALGKLKSPKTVSTVLGHSLGKELKNHFRVYLEYLGKDCQTSELILYRMQLFF